MKVHRFTELDDLVEWIQKIAARGHVGRVFVVHRPREEECPTICRDARTSVVVESVDRRSEIDDVLCFELEVLPFARHHVDVAISFASGSKEKRQAVGREVRSGISERTAGIRKYGHIHLDDVVERKDRFKNELIIAAHFSTRYHHKQIRDLVHRRLPDMFEGRLNLWL